MSEEMSQSQIYENLNNTSDEKLRQELKDIGRIEEKDLDLAVSLLRKICTEDGRIEVVKDLAKDKTHENGCVGAITPAYMLTRPSTIAELTFVVANGINGGDLYTLWNDCAKRDGQGFILNIWALQSGVYKQSEIDENFRVNHLNIHDRNSGDFEWAERANRIGVLPFVYNEKLINPKDYISDLEHVEPTSDEFKNFVRANRAYNRFYQYLIQTRLETEGKIKATGKDEITVSMILPEISRSKYSSYQLIIKQPKDNEVSTFSVNTNQILELIADRPETKHFDMANRYDMVKALYFLKDAKKQFLPGLPVIRSFPEGEVKNFYANQNDKRYGMLAKLMGSKDYYEQEALVKLCYITGLFSPSEKESKTAFNYIKQNVLSKIIPTDIHKLYGHINLESGYNRDFAQFFMLHHSKNPHCFENSEGVDKTADIYENFAKILAFRPEKEINTTTNNKRLMPEDAINCISNLCCMLGLPPEYEPYLKVIGKYTGNKNALSWYINRLKVGKEIPPEQVTIPYVKDISTSPCKFRVLEKGNPEVAISGLRTNCCFRYEGAAESALVHALTSPNSSVVVFESQKGFTQGWVWYDKDNKLLVIDNLEGVPERNEDNKSLCDNLIGAVVRYADETYKALNERGLPCTSINLGTGYLSDVIRNTLSKFEREGVIEKENDPKISYPQRNHLYTDAHEQYVITNEELLQRHETLSLEPDEASEE